MNAMSWSRARRIIGYRDGVGEPNRRPPFRRNDILGEPQHVVGQRLGDVYRVFGRGRVIPAVDQEFNRQDADRERAGYLIGTQGHRLVHAAAVPCVQCRPGGADNLALHRVVGVSLRQLRAGRATEQGDRFQQVVGQLQHVIFRARCGFGQLVTRDRMQNVLQRSQRGFCAGQFVGGR